MSLKVKVLCLSAITALTISAVAVMNASATTGGHFISSETQTVISGLESGAHQLELTVHGLNGGLLCDSVSYSGTTNSTTVTDVVITPSYANCHTTGEGAGTSVVQVNGCTYRFTVAPESGGNVEGTVDLLCPEGKALEVVHPSCTMKIPGQNNISKITYTTITEGGKHLITLDINMQFNVLFEAKACILLGTNGHTGTLQGSATAKGSKLEQVDITAT